MDSEELNQRISRIETQWTLLRDAHCGENEQAQRAMESLFQRYQRPVYAYLAKSLRDFDAADEVFQIFSLRLVQGGYRHADAARGRFRSYLKTSLARMIVDYRRSKSKQHYQNRSEDSFLTDVQGDSGADDSFDNACRDELLTRTWRALEAHEQRTGQRYHTLLQLKSQHPDLPSGELARLFVETVGKPHSLEATRVRKTLQRARERFADLLLDEVANSLHTQDPGQLETELVELQLLPYCRSGKGRVGRSLRKKHRQHVGRSRHQQPILQVLNVRQPLLWPPLRCPFLSPSRARYLLPFGLPHTLCLHIRRFGPAVT